MIRDRRRVRVECRLLGGSRAGGAGKSCGSEWRRWRRCSQFGVWTDGSGKCGESGIIGGSDDRSCAVGVADFYGRGDGAGRNDGEYGGMGGESDVFE